MDILKAALMGATIGIIMHSKRNQGRREGLAGIPPDNLVADLKARWAAQREEEKIQKEASRIYATKGAYCGDLHAQALREKADTAKKEQAVEFYDLGER